MRLGGLKFLFLLKHGQKDSQNSQKKRSRIEINITHKHKNSLTFSKIEQLSRNLARQFFTKSLQHFPAEKSKNCIYRFLSGKHNIVLEL